MIRTFLDSGVLIAAARLLDPGAEGALEFLDDADRVFLTSPFVQLEVVPKAIFFKKRLERSFYDRYFTNAEWFRDVDKIESVAQAEAARAGLGAYFFNPAAQFCTTVSGCASVLCSGGITARKRWLPVPTS